MTLPSPRMQDPWQEADPQVLATGECADRVPEFTATAVVPQSWLLDHGPTHRLDGPPLPVGTWLPSREAPLRRGRHRARWWRR